MTYQEVIALQHRVKELEDINHTLTEEIERLNNKMQGMNAIHEFHVNELVRQIQTAPDKPMQPREPEEGC